MGYAKQGNNLVIWGRATRDATLIETKSGKWVSGFAVKYDYRHNTDGDTVIDYMEVSVWGNLAKTVGDANIGVGKGDMVLVAGQLIQDTFYKKGEDRSQPKYKLNAELVLDQTSINQLMEMVVGTAETEEPEPEPEPAPKKKPITATDQPIFEDVDDEYDPFSDASPAEPFISKEDEEAYDLPY